MIEKLGPLNEHATTEPEVRARDMIFRLEDKINELIDEVNRLAKEPVPHEHRAMGGPANAHYDKFTV